MKILTFQGSEITIRLKIGEVCLPVDDGLGGRRLRLDKITSTSTTNEEVKAKWNAKDTVFVDLFHIPKYRFQLFQALHPEMTDVT